MIAAAIALVGCSETPPPEPEDTTAWRDVAAVFEEHCVECHHDGGVATFALSRYEDAANWAEVALAAMQARTMPPWGATGDGSCGEFRNSRWLPDDAIDRVASWVEAGSPEGEPHVIRVPEPPSLTDAAVFTTPRFTPEAVGGPLAEFDEYRCFLVDPELDRDVFVTGYAVQPGTPALVHHLLAMQVHPGDEAASGGITNLEAIQARDAAAPDRAGWPCLGDEAGPEVEFAAIPVSWAPGQGVLQFPAGTGVRLEAEDVFVVQIHYNLFDPQTAGESDQTELQLSLADTVDREGLFLLPDGLLDAPGETLEPGLASVEYSWDLQVSDLAGPAAGVDVYGVFPHMHELGRRLSASVERGGGGTDCAVEVTDWDFNWQLYYFYDEPMRLRSADTLHVTCDYDTREAAAPVIPGWGTRNEMCLLGLYVVP